MKVARFFPSCTILAALFLWGSVSVLAQPAGTETPALPAKNPVSGGKNVPDFEFAEAEPNLRPVERWMIEYQSGVLWRVNDESQADYVLLPQIITLEVPPHDIYQSPIGDFAIGFSARTILEPIVRGVESYYLGFSFGPAMEYWPTDRFVLYFRPGGGFGWTDANPSDPNGQGQDFTLNFNFEGGMRYYLNDNLAISLSTLFKHYSNADMAPQNPGLNQVGPLLGISWSF